ncbi:type II secretion system protein, partial [Actinomycetospora atypica]
MTAAALVLLALAVLTWPAAAAPGRLRALGATAPAQDRSWRRPPPVVLTGLGALVATLLAGPGGAVAALVVGAVLLRARRGRRRESDAAAAVAGLAEGLAAFAAELR